MTAETDGTDFDDWVVSTYRDVGSFTMLFVLLRIGDTSVDLLRSAYLHVVGDELRWPNMVQLFRGAGVDWSGAVFYRAGREGLVEDGEAKSRLTSLVFKLNEDRSLIREGDLFNADGLRLTIEEIKPH
ncbi:hypothetical protein CDO28_20760 (plasmid) [Sinorhizobium meliloti]|uniref:hypothetical protein n=1 Tax=Rhizobium meliloti TaxID=382 RepID=UPI000B49F589|nr:hypothetical protein [Sinorhizobium meliloti]ASP73960.1 hypothetical protein CDO28_20760 [Sinorhizobium meliloti]MDE3857095.1 hypothetical protein [Sinorhizobium meliloti]MQW48268.1 hypothetical protein [Sinorhizobium meliloti]MQW50931.1 hypothetical protein [Sinorhizobium meliloti]